MTFRAEANSFARASAETIKQAVIAGKGVNFVSVQHEPRWLISRAASAVRQGGKPLGGAHERAH